MNFAEILSRWRQWIRFVVVITYIVLLVIALPLCIYELERKGAPDHVQAWFVGGMFVLMALPISFWGILQHIINYTTPHLQRHIISHTKSNAGPCDLRRMSKSTWLEGILWMVPVYALNAWFALRFPSAAIYLDTLRECYEAYVIYNFMAYLLSFLNHEYPHLDIQIENKPPVKHIFPLCLLPPCHNSPKFVQRCKHGVLQYTVVRPAMTVLALICEIFHKYDEGDFNFTSAWSYIVIINNISQVLAMYCLVLFYKAFKDELQPLKPVPKFLCVKAVVFLSFWQALLIAALAKLGAIPKNGSWVFYKDIKEVSTGLQDFLICIEMFLAAIAHYFSFSHKPFVNLAAEQLGWFSAFKSMFNVRDVTQDVAEHARYIGRGMHKTLSRGKRLVVNDNSSETTPLLADGNSQASNRVIVRQSSIQNSQSKEPPTPAVIVEAETISAGGDSVSGLQYDSFVNKSTTASMNNYIDFDRPETSGQLESTQNLSRSVSLKGCDENETDNVNSKFSEIHGGAFSSSKTRATETVNQSSNKHEAFEHVEIHPNDPYQNSIRTSRSVCVNNTGTTAGESSENQDKQYDDELGNSKSAGDSHIEVHENAFQLRNDDTAAVDKCSHEDTNPVV